MLLSPFIKSVFAWFQSLFYFLSSQNCSLSMKRTLVLPTSSAPQYTSVIDPPFVRGPQNRRCAAFPLFFSLAVLSPFSCPSPLLLLFFGFEKNYCCPPYHKEGCVGVVFFFVKALVLPTQPDPPVPIRAIFLDLTSRLVFQTLVLKIFPVWLYLRDVEVS